MGLAGKHKAFFELLLNSFADGIEEQGPSFAMRWIFKASKEQQCKEINSWIDSTVCDYVEKWLASNRGCFGLLQAIEASENKKLIEKVKKINKIRKESC